MAETIKKAEKPVEVKANAKEERVRVFVPLLPKGEPQELYLSVNFKGYLIKRGQTVDMPRSVYEVYENALAAETSARAYSDSKAISADKVQYLA